jgi:hypothetical protein
MAKREKWVGNAERSGILQGIGTVGFLISIALVCLSFVTLGDASIRYEIFVAAHTLLYSGSALAYLADIVAKRPFSSQRLVLTGVLGFVYGILGPLVMSAAVAAQHR